MADIRHMSSNEFIESLVRQYLDRKSLWERAMGEPNADPDSDDYPHMFDHITVWRLTREYGGPEEGGWWYDAGEVELTLHFHGERELRVFGAAIFDVLKKRVAGSRPYTSVIGGTDYRVHLTVGRGEAFPVEVPTYC